MTLRNRTCPEEVNPGWEKTNTMKKSPAAKQWKLEVKLSSEKKRKGTLIKLITRERNVSKKKKYQASD